MKDILIEWIAERLRSDPSFDINIAASIIELVALHDRLS